jgi:mannose-6-phosphate isomerase-like protein (cupin superfamily)
MADTDRVLGDVGTAVILDNDRVKIWEMDLQPGEESDEHRHDLDYILVILEGDRIAGISTDGRDDIEADVHPGLTVYVPKGGTEIARNIGQERYREILIELKGT